MILLFRLHQWLKNFLLFVPLFFSGHIQDIDLLIQISAAFLSFSLMASAVYVLNDYVDIERDKLHPIKQFRPLASGEVSKPKAQLMFLLLFVASIISSLLIDYHLALIVLIYFVLNVLYSIRLKHDAIIDITIISIGFLLRIFAGSLPFDIMVSKWLIIMIFLSAMFIGIAKRRGELILENEGATRKSLEGYNLQFVDIAMVMMAAVTIVCYMMYTVSEEVVARIGSDYIYITTFFVIIGILRYLQLTIVFGKTETPTKVFLKDRFIQVCIICWILVFGWFLYGFNIVF